MQFGKRLRDNHSKGIKDFSPLYFEMTYLKYDTKLTVVFMAPSKNKAQVKAKSILHTLNGRKILNIRVIDSKNLAKNITWNKSGRPYSKHIER